MPLPYFITKWKELAGTSDLHRRYLLRARLAAKIPAIKRYDVYRCRMRCLRVLRSPAELFSGRRDNLFITSVPHYTTGIGHSVMEWNSGYAYAKHFGIQYAHIDIRSDWEAVLGLGLGEVKVKDLRRAGIRLLRLPPLPSTTDQSLFSDDMVRQLLSEYRPSRPTLIVLYDGQIVFGQTLTAAQLSDKYHKLNPVRAKKRTEIRVAVHIRRPGPTDVNFPDMHRSDSEEYRTRCLPVDYFITQCKVVADAIGLRPACMEIYSTAQAGELSELAEMGNSHLRIEINTHLREHDAFRRMVDADILVGSPSSFSYLAALISCGVRIFPFPYHHKVPESGGWVRADRTRGGESLVAEVRQKLAIVERC
jgi:hypothetical protein